MANPLNNEVEALLQRTDTLLRSSVGGDRSPSENGRSERQSIKPSIFSRGRASISSVHSSSETDGGEPNLEAAAYGRTSLDGASRQPIFKRPTAVQRATDTDSEAATPRLIENMGRPPPSIAPTETILDHSGPTSLNLSLPGGSKDGRAYNSFGGLQEMVSMVDTSTAPANQPTSTVAGTGVAQGSRLSFATGPFGGVGARGLASSIDVKPPTRMRSPSRLGSPAPSPRSALRKPSQAVPAAAPSAKVPRRVQLQALLSKDIAQPQDVVKFKAEMKCQGQLTANVAHLAGDLQERFDRVNRKLKNWNLIESAATERFNAAMDAALEALFSRINLAWPAGELPSGASDSSAGNPSTSAYDSLRSRSHSKGGRSDPMQSEGPAEKSVDRPSHSRRRVSHAPGSFRTDDTDEGGYGSPTSSASQRYAWDEELSTTDAEDDGSGGSLRRGGSRSRSAARPSVAAGGTRHRGDSRRQTPPRTAGHAHDTARADAEGKSRRVHHHTADMVGVSTGASRPPPPGMSAWHVGPNGGTYLTAAAPPAMHQSVQQPMASAPSAGFGAPFPPNSSAMLGMPQPPYMSASAAYMGSGFLAPSAGPAGAAGHAGLHPYSFTAGDSSNMAAQALGPKPVGVQLPDHFKAAGVDMHRGFPFGGSELWAHLYGAPGMPTNPAFSGVRSAGCANDNSTLLYRPEQGASSSAVSCMAPCSSLGNHSLQDTTASEVCATASTGALHSTWQASSTHSNVQPPANGTQRSSTGGPSAMPTGYNPYELRPSMAAFPDKPAFGNMAAIGGPGAHGLAFTGFSDLLGGTSMPTIPNLAAGHPVTYGGPGYAATGYERLAPGQYLR